MFPWPDHLPPRLLKKCVIEISLTFCSLLSRSFFAGEVTYAWRIANIVPIHKKGKKDCTRNSRQISLTSIACKVSEKIVKDRVVKFGFLNGKSNLTQLLCCFDDWTSSRNKPRLTALIFKDFSKAFDFVPHERLLLNLQCHAMDGSLLHWFTSFLTNRQQCTVFRGTHWHCNARLCVCELHQ